MIGPMPKSSRCSLQGARDWLRCTGFNNVDLDAAAQLGIKVVRVVTYSPYSVAQHAVALLQAINRRIHRAYNPATPTLRSTG